MLQSALRATDFDRELWKAVSTATRSADKL